MAGHSGVNCRVRLPSQGTDIYMLLNFFCFIHSSIDPFICSFIHSFIHSFIFSFIYSSPLPCFCFWLCRCVCPYIRLPFFLLSLFPLLLKYLFHWSSKQKYAITCTTLPERKKKEEEEEEEEEERKKLRRLLFLRLSLSFFVVVV